MATFSCFHEHFVKITVCQFYIKRISIKLINQLKWSLDSRILSIGLKGY